MSPERPELPALFRWWGPGPGPATDYIDLDHVIQLIDEGLRAQVIAAKFEAVASMHRAVAEGAMKIAGIIGGQQRTK